jgi:hypothetical protein
MGTPTQYLITDGHGKVIGNGFTPDGTLPKNAHPCTQEHIAKRYFYNVDEETHAITVRPPSEEQQKAAHLAMVRTQIATLERQQTPELLRRAVVGNPAVDYDGRTASEHLAWLDREIEALRVDLR